MKLTDGFVEHLIVGRVRIGSGCGISLGPMLTPLFVLCVWPEGADELLLFLFCTELTAAGEVRAAVAVLEAADWLDCGCVTLVDAFEVEG